MTISPDARFQRNLESLAIHQTDAAERIAAASVPEGVLEATGRDGSATFRVPHPGGLEWLGRSSAPTISAEALVEGILIGVDNLVLPGVLTGREILLLLQRMPMVAALFVIEQEAWRANLVLRLWDYTEPLRAGRLVLLPFEDPFSALIEFFDRHPGYEAPARLVAAPQCPPLRIADGERRLTHAVLAIHNAQRSRAQSLREQCRLSDIDDPSIIRAVVLGNDPRPGAIALARDLGNAMVRCGAAVEVCVPDRPSRVHALALLSAMIRMRTNFPIFLGTPCQGIEGFWPDDMPLMAWFQREVLRVGQLGCAPSRISVAFAASATGAAALRAHGIPADRIRILPPGLPDEWWDASSAPDNRRPQVGPGRRDVALVADLPDDRPEAHGILQTSQRRLWEALREECREHVASTTPLRPAHLLARAVERSGVPIQDEKWESCMKSRMEDTIVPAAWARAADAGLRRAGLDVSYWGHGWQIDPPTPGIAHRPVPADAAAALTVVRDTSILAFASLDESHIPLLLLGLAHGCDVVARRGKHTLGEEYPDLAEFERSLHVVESVEEFVARIQWLHAVGRDPSHRENRSRRWGDLIRDRHLLSHRAAVMLRSCGASRPTDRILTP